MEPFKFKVGRPPKFCEEICTAIIKSVSDLLPLKIAAEENGVHYETLRAWINEGLEDLMANNWTEKAQFSVALKKEVANSMRLLSKRVRGGCDGWQGSAWILERRWWKYWSSKVADLDFNERLTALENDHKQKDLSNGNLESSEKK